MIGVPCQGLLAEYSPLFGAPLEPQQLRRLADRWDTVRVDFDRFPQVSLCGRHPARLTTNRSQKKPGLDRLWRCEQSLAGNDLGFGEPLTPFGLLDEGDEEVSRIGSRTHHYFYEAGDRPQFLQTFEFASYISKQCGQVTVSASSTVPTSGSGPCLSCS